jgi:hypothetical protein
VTAKLDLSSCPVSWWLPERQLQTLYGALLARTHRVSFIRDRIETPDGDFIDMDWSAPGLIAQPVATQKIQPHALESKETHLTLAKLSLQDTGAARWMTPADRGHLETINQQTGIKALVLMHGLEGSSKSRYVQSIAQHIRARGWVVVIAHFRGCSGFPNRLARAYHSGDSEEIAFILESVRKSVPQAIWHAAGVSLGGNALLKYLGEYPEQSTWLNAAAGISVPLDLVAAGNHLSDDPFNRHIYSRYFLRSLKPKVLEKAKRFPGVIDVMRIAQARDLRDFDDAYTAPMHGFKNAMDYWTQSASKPWLPHIRVPTLVLNARNDPFLPEPTLPSVQQASDHVLLHQPASGGHAGFVSGQIPGELTWLPERLARFFNQGN